MIDCSGIHKPYNSPRTDKETLREHHHGIRRIHPGAAAWLPPDARSEVIQNSIEQTVVAEQAGFNTAWYAEHHFNNYSLLPVAADDDRALWPA